MAKSKTQPKKATTKKATPSPEPKVTIIPISKIKFRKDNPRHHSDENIDLITSSIRRNKAGRSTLIDEKNQLLAGEGTTRSAIKAGVKEVVVIETTGDQLVAVKRIDLNETQKQEMIVLDNRANETSDWDSNKIAGMLHKLRDAGSSVELFGFNDADLEHFRLSGDFNDEDFDQFFQPAEHHKSDPTKLHFHFTFDKKTGERVLKALQKIDPKPENALLTLLDIPIPKEPKQPRKK